MGEQMSGLELFVECLFPGRSQPVSLHEIDYALPESRPVLVLLHGLLGSSRNLRSCARALSDDYTVLLPDLRGHGQSPHSRKITLPQMAEDVELSLALAGCQRVRLLGHSLGGKVAMLVALRKRIQLDALLVEDIAPISYPPTHSPLLQAMSSLRLAELNSRAEIDAELANAVPEASLRGFLLQNLVRENGVYRWRIALEALCASYDDLRAGFSSSADTASATTNDVRIDHGASFDGPALFVGGEYSDYLDIDREQVLGRWFPNYGYEQVPTAGHWIHSEQPENFIEIARNFFAE